MKQEVAYLDTSAAVKLLIAEAETEHLKRSLARTDGWTSSVLLIVELRSATDRLTASVLSRESVDGLLNRCSLVAVDDGVIARASNGFQPPQRALDAVHLATAVGLGLANLRFYSYDRQQLKAARRQRLPCVSPGQR